MVLSISIRELLAVEYGLHYFAPQLVDSTVVVFVDNSTAIACLCNQGGTKSPLLNSVAQRILRWAESIPVVLAPQFIKGKNNVLADAMPRPNQIQGSEWTLIEGSFSRTSETLAGDVRSFRHLVKSPMLSIFFALPRSEGARDAFLQTWDNYQVFAFPPWSLIPRVLKKLRLSSGALMTLVAPWWPQRLWFPELLDLMIDCPVRLPQSRDLLRQPHFHRHYLEISKLSLHAWRLSSDSPNCRDSLHE